MFRYSRSGQFATNAVIAGLVLAFTTVSIAWSSAGDDAFADAKATGSLTVKIKPKDAKKDGARWRVDGGAWQKGGKTVDNLDTGDHEVSFKETPGWKTPKDKTVTINANAETSTSGKYKADTSSMTIMLPGDVPLEFVWIPAGSFLMGRYTNELHSEENESPQHAVTFDTGFWMGKYEVTQAQWLAVMVSNPSFFTGDLSRPVDRVSWNDTQAFITAVNALGQGAVRLPSEAEWEYACRGGTTTRFYWGDDLIYTEIGPYAWYYNNSSTTTHPVGQKTANPFGLFDMSGNVWEWCEDWYHSSYIGAPADGGAWVSPTTPSRVLRGASWQDSDYYHRSADRYDFPVAGTSYIFGFRLAR